METLDDRANHGRDCFSDPFTHCFAALNRKGHTHEFPQVVGVGQVERDAIKDCNVVGQPELNLGDKCDIDHEGHDGGWDCRR